MACNLFEEVSVRRSISTSVLVMVGFKMAAKPEEREGLVMEVCR